MGWTTGAGQVLPHLASRFLPVHISFATCTLAPDESPGQTPGNERSKRRSRPDVGLAGFCLFGTSPSHRRSSFRWQRRMLVAILDIIEGGEREGVIRMFRGHVGTAWCLEPVKTQRSTSWRATVSQREGLRPDAPPQSGSSSWCRAGRKRSEVRDCESQHIKHLSTGCSLNPSPQQQLANHRLATVSRHNKLVKLWISPHAMMCVDLWWQQDLICVRNRLNSVFISATKAAIISTSG